MERLVPLAIVFPLLMAALLVVLEKKRGKHRLLDILSLGSTLVLLVFDLLLTKRSLSGTMVSWLGEWQPINGFAAGIALVVDPAAAGLASLAALLTAMGLLFSWHHFKAAGIFFHSLMLLFLAAMTGFCLSGDMFNLFVFFELMGVAGYALTGYKIEDTGPLEGALNFAVMNSLGAIFVLFGIAILYARTGVLNLAGAGAALARSGSDFTIVMSFLLLLIGFLVKGAIVPFHFWLPDAHAVAPTPASVLFSGIMVELGLYAIARIYWTVFHGSLPEDKLRLLLVGIGVVTALTGAGMAFIQRHLKRMLAFSTVSHAGIILTGIGLASVQGLEGTLQYIAGHGCIKGALFICCGIIIHRRSSIDEEHLRGRCRSLWITAAIFFTAGLALAGLPPFAPWAGKTAVEAAARQLGVGWLTPVLMTASAVTGGAVLRTGAALFLGWGRGSLFSLSAPSTGELELPETDQSEKRTPPVMWFPALILVTAAFAAGWATEVAVFCSDAAERFMDTQAYRSTVLGGMPSAAAGQTVHSPDRETGMGLAAALVAAAIAAGALFMYCLPDKTLQRVKLVIEPVISLARTIHSGYVGDYAAWFLGGAALLMLLAALVPL